MFTKNIYPVRTSVVEDLNVHNRKILTWRILQINLALKVSGNTEQIGSENNQQIFLKKVLVSD